MQHVTDRIRVHHSQVWQTTTGIIDAGEGVILLDPGVLPDELEALMAALGDRPVVAGFATHAHWDHILWPVGADDAPRYASAETCTLVDRRREHLEHQLDAFANEVERDYGDTVTWDRSRFFDLTPMPPGASEIAGVPVELVEIPGHAEGQVALVLPEHGAAFVADTLSDIEIPSLAAGDQVETYLVTLDRLQAIIDRVTWIIPGHGEVADRREAQRRLDLDRRYLEHLPQAVAAAPVDQTDDEIARQILADLGETRAEEGLSAQMHLDNVGMVREVRKRG